MACIHSARVMSGSHVLVLASAMLVLALALVLYSSQLSTRTLLYTNEHNPMSACGVVCLVSID